MIRYQITDGAATVDEDRWLARLRRDVDFIQIRERGLNARQLARLVRKVLACVPGPRILVNDRADVAIACGAAGVHLRAGSVPPRLIRTLAPLIVTVACHSAADVARAEGANFAILAPVFTPLSKPGQTEPHGLEGLRRAARDAALPVIALGGITERNAAQCVEAGAVGVAGITLFSR